ncbi:hypothetical protein E2562_017396 [Oryza meyeriana var. granulata]|uniref:Uncharacterized protein n=1 Tax=Oryza meyeriana var. granulata TaxID=110450 RepID=A0A6G1D6Q4_9ORYZ|nr:hypothetical protein E2562_017396 [Oryza meyeriana var. granulata]
MPFKVAMPCRPAPSPSSNALSPAMVGTTKSRPENAWGPRREAAPATAPVGPTVGDAHRARRGEGDLREVALVKTLFPTGACVGPSGGDSCGSAGDGEAKHYVPDNIVKLQCHFSLK